MGGRPELLIMTGPLAGKRVAVPDGGLRMGRSSANDVHIPDEELSRNHCLFEADGPDAIRVMDLASANGTFVNGTQLDGASRALKTGDIIEVGTTMLKVVDKDAPDATVCTPPPPAAASAAPQSATLDLGLGSAKGSDVLAGAKEAQPDQPRAPLANILWGLVALSVVSAIAIVLTMPTEEPPRPAAIEKAAAAPAPLYEVLYEKVEADAAHIFRYQMTIDREGILRVVYDDVPDENRHIDKSAKLSQKARADIAEIFSPVEWRALDAAYTGTSSAGENALRSWRIRTVCGDGVKDTVVENTVEPPAFKAARERLETFSRNELGVWALQYSRDQLVSLGAESEKLGDAKWNERDVEYGNISAAIATYRDGVFYLETVDPKPAGYAQLKDKLDAAAAELDKRYRDQRFLADKALNLGDWATAARELRILCDMVPGRDDERHAEATAKLVDVERRMKNEKHKPKKGASK